MNLVRKITKDLLIFPLFVLFKPSKSIIRQWRIKFSWSKMGQSLTKIFNFVDVGLEEISGDIGNWGKWLDAVAEILFDILFGVVKFE